MNWQSIITIASVIAAILALYGYLAKAVRFVDRQKEQDKELKSLREKHDQDIADLKDEQKILVIGILACLKGLAEQGCDGPVHEAIETIEKHLNEKAHQ